MCSLLSRDAELWTRRLYFQLTAKTNRSQPRNDHSTAKLHAVKYILLYHVKENITKVVN